MIKFKGVKKIEKNIPNEAQLIGNNYLNPQPKAHFSDSYKIQSKEFKNNPLIRWVSFFD